MKERSSLSYLLSSNKLLLGLLAIFLFAGRTDHCDNLQLTTKTSQTLVHYHTLQRNGVSYAQAVLIAFPEFNTLIYSNQASTHSLLHVIAYKEYLKKYIPAVPRGIALYTAVHKKEVPLPPAFS